MHHTLSDIACNTHIHTIHMCTLVLVLVLPLHTHTHTHHIHVYVCPCNVQCGAALCRYPWHVVFTALRILIETGDLYGGNYFAVNDDGEYIGYQ